MESKEKKMMLGKDRKMMLCRCSYGASLNFYPSVILQGKWLKDFGFSAGDQIVISNPSYRTLVMTVHKSAKEMNEERLKRA